MKAKTALNWIKFTAITTAYFTCVFGTLYTLSYTLAWLTIEHSTIGEPIGILYLINLPYLAPLTIFAIAVFWIIVFNRIARKSSKSQ